MYIIRINMPSTTEISPRANSWCCEKRFHFISALKQHQNVDVVLRKKKIERLSVVVTGFKTEKIITIVKIYDGTGSAIANTVHDHVLDWKVSDAIVAICTDTTASNTGREKGSVVLFQKLLGRNVTYFACRHHVLELFIGAVFVKLFGESSGPSPDMFENFKRDWFAIDQSSFNV